jgi:hypothetical protein
MSQEMIEFKFHISPAPSSSRPQTCVGTSGTSLSSCRARSGSLLRRCGLSTASATSGMTPSRQRRTFVAEEAEAASPVCADRALGDDTSLAALAPCRRLFDHEPSRRYVHLERRVVEVGAIAMLQARGDCFEDEPVQADGVAAGAERQPVQIDSADRSRRRRRPSGVTAAGSCTPSASAARPSARRSASGDLGDREVPPAHPQDASRPRPRPSIAAPARSRSGRCLREPSRSSPRPRAARHVPPGPRC